MRKVDPTTPQDDAMPRSFALCLAHIASSPTAPSSGLLAATAMAFVEGGEFFPADAQNLEPLAQYHFDAMVDYCIKEGLNTDEMAAITFNFKALYLLFNPNISDVKN